MEVEFPPLPEDVSVYEESAEMYFDANVALAMQAAKYLNDQGYTVRVLNPDRYELENCRSSTTLTVQQSEGKIQLGHTREYLQGPLQGLTQLFSSQSDSLPAGAEDADVYIAINHQSVEYGILKGYAERVIKDKPLVLWNPELYEYRGKFGVPGLPPRSVHWEFLAFFKPVLYFQRRDFTSRKDGVPLEVAGALFREYPGPWRCMLRTEEAGQYREIAQQEARYTIEGVLAELRRAKGITAQDTIVAGFQRSKGLVAWWEKDLHLEKSSAWRT